MLLFELPNWMTGFNFLVALFGVLVVIGGAYLTIIARSKTDSSGLQTERAVAAEGILKIRDTELASCKAELVATNQELDDLTAEHRTLVGINIGALLEFWKEKEGIEAKILKCEREIRVLKLAGGDKDS